MVEQEIVLQEDLDAFGLKDSSFLFTTYEVLEYPHILFEDDTYKENVVQTRSQLTKSPLKGPRKPNEQENIVQSNLCPSSSKAPNKVNISVRIQNSYNIVDHLHKMQVILPIKEVMKIPQQKNIYF